MQREEIEAEQNLASFSQVTNYICQWRDKRLKNPQIHQKAKDNIPDKIRQHSTAFKNQRKSTLSRETSQKYDLKKWQKRVEAINKIQFPILGDNLFLYQEQYLIQKSKINQLPHLEQSTHVFQRREGINKRIIQALEEEYIKKKLEKFRQRIEESRKKVMKQESTAKLRYVPKALMSKKSISLGKNIIQEQRNQQSSSKSQIQKLRRELDKNKRKFSLPNLYKF